MNDLIGETIGNYQIEALLGSGGMGRVFRARHIHLGRPAALKLMHEHLARDPMFQERFLREARSVAALRHPHIIEVYDFVAAEDRAYMVIEFIGAGSLRSWMGRRNVEGQGWSMITALELIRQAAEALAHAHSQGIIHRDIKPDNMLIEEASEGSDRPPTLKLADFGLAQLLESDRLTASGVAMGTPAYMSPEQCQGHDLDARSDIYALGVVLYEVTVGRLPFEVRSTTDAVYKHVFELPPPPGQFRPDIPPVLEEIILRCLAKAPADRFDSANELAAALRDLLLAEAPQMQGLVQPGAGVILPTFGMNPTAMQPGGATAVPQVRTLVSPATHPRVRVMDTQGNTLQVVELRGRALTAGRAPSNNLVLDSEGVSRHHFQLSWDGQQVNVTDLGSGNGTTLGDVRLPAQEARHWPWRTLLRIGPYWLRLEPPSVAPGASGAISGTMPAGTMSGPVSIAASGAFVTTERFMLRPESDLVTLTPGQASTWTLRVANLDSLVVELSISFSGVPQEWISGGDRTLQLYPGTQQDVTITILVPATPESAARDYVVRVRGRSREHPGQGAQAQALWIVQPYYRGSIEVTPKRAGGRTGTGYQIIVHNEGNTPVTYQLIADDGNDLLRYLFANDTVSVEPGTNETVRVHVENDGHLIGSLQSHTFTVTATAGGSVPALQATAQYLQVPLLPIWAAGLLALLVLLIGGWAVAGNQLPPRPDPVSAATTTTDIVPAQQATVAGVEAALIEQTNAANPDQPIQPTAIVGGDLQASVVAQDVTSTAFIQAATANAATAGAATQQAQTQAQAGQTATGVTAAQGQSAIALQGAATQSAATAQTATSLTLAQTATAQQLVVVSATDQAFASATAQRATALAAEAAVTAQQNTAVAAETQTIEAILAIEATARSEQITATAQQQQTAAAAQQQTATAQQATAQRVTAEAQQTASAAQQQTATAAVLQTATVQRATAYAEQTIVAQQITATAAQQQTATALDTFVGDWRNIDSATGGMTRLIITAINPNTVSFHGFGSCSPSDCDWGIISVPFTPSRLVGVYNFGYKTTTITVWREGDQLVAENFDDYTDSDGRTDRLTRYFMWR